MQLLFDVGNTNINICIYTNHSIIDIFKLSTYPRRTADELAMSIRFFLEKNGYFLQDVSSVLVSSVVPLVNEIIIWFCEQNDLSTPFFITEQTKLPITIGLTNPSEIGDDLLTAAIAAHSMYPQKHVIVLDFGTASTITTITKDGIFLGGAILPGVEVCFQSLIQNTALLKEASFQDEPISAIGNSTSKAIQSGITYGYAGMIENIVNKTIAELPEGEYIVIKTGGQAHYTNFSSKVPAITRPDLIFDGLVMLYEYNL